MARRGGRPWRRIRAYVLARDQHTCQLQTPGICTTTATEVDHIETINDRPDLELDPNNCRAVCNPCHTYRTLTHKPQHAPAPPPPPSRRW